jgi:endonuclease YncB( thermonuclease family)
MPVFAWQKPHAQKKASHLRRLFFCLLLSAFGQLAAAACPPDRIDQSGTVEFVADGDTVILDTGQKVRFIGINTPEKGRDGRPHEPLAEAARQRLQQLLDKHDMSMSLRYGKELHDRHGRLLAHPFLPDGSNLTEKLLADGLGFHVVVPPNDWSLSCYIGAEKQARQAGKGVWGNAWYKPRDSRSLPRNSRGFMRVRGKVVRIGKSRKASWINLQGRVALRLANKDKQHFARLDINSLKGKTITVRGWFYPSKGRHDDLRVNLHHPASLELD